MILNFDGDFMTRISKQGKRRAASPRRPRIAGKKTGPKKDALERGYKIHTNAISAESEINRFIPRTQ